MSIKDEDIYYFPINISWQIEPSNDLVYVLNKKNNRFFYFQYISKKIWLQIQSKKKIKSIIKDLAIEFDVAYEVIHDDIVDFVKELLQEELIFKYE